MPRKTPISNKRRKEQLLVKRALKRGDISIEDHDAIRTQQKLKTAKRRPGAVAARSGGPVNTTSRKLQSKFIALSADYVARTRNLAYALPLERPLPPERAVFPLEILEDRDPKRRLICPSRPKFRYGQTKTEVEKNEEGVFKKWLKNVEEVVHEWVDGDEEQVYAGESIHQVPRGPTWFETNLEVWRQFWRVTEASQILLLLLDSRCPPLHCPPSLRTHLKSLVPSKEIILVLTKSDLVDAKALEAWKIWIRSWWGQESVHIVSVRSKGRHKPDIPQQSLDELISALQAAHKRLLERSVCAKEDKKLDSWKPSVRPSVDWASLKDEDHIPDPRLDTVERIIGPQNSLRKLSSGKQDEQTTPQVKNPSTEPLTLGLIGQPNVGKSSLLNALLGEQKVRASRTPGKTKHFQTMFWGPKKEIKIVDCPGLVCPSLAGLEIQAMAGIIPISQIPSLPSCILFASAHMPIEVIFRRAREREEEERKRDKWTVGGVLEARALDKGFMTAKGGRPDINRAANGMMRALADGKVRWGFYPPGMAGKTCMGIWLGDDDPEGVEEGDIAGASWDERDEDDEEFISQESEFADERTDEEGEVEQIEDEQSEGEVANSNVKQIGGFFAALEVTDSEEGGSEDEDIGDAD
ncbi:GTPase [Cryptococcus gattii E566]|uniref:Guanine nucleotide-binding protein-like 1 n=2 Tax=Cryptococcus gattii TaxID=37769 RepID=E6QY91_CRYGW|nr:GTPase, putative [Cryptococcus gattii WM276]ADV19791.1 GTPase, putative [Cryptococcus gattii WM276]KIR79635.1 GTPase [Cryptococcus gattii EJB2]KIY37211.1 GTPase [Cryptococcus gattii E566]KJE03107.1 GTPase [Cryptococcus gattii NT-10]